jgi:hypothetical protein
VTADADPRFLRRLAGHIETGYIASTASNSPAVTIWVIPSGTNSMPATNAVPAPFALPSTLDPVPATNVLKVFGVVYGTNFMVLYPGWASNCVIEARTNLFLGSWVPVNAASNIMGNYIVVPLPLTPPNRCFRLRH